MPSPTKVMVTTRHRLDVAYPVRLVGLSEDEALELIADEARVKGVGLEESRPDRFPKPVRSGADTLTPDQARQLYQRTGGVPLAIVWSVAQIGFGYGVEAVLTRLGQPTNDIAKFCFEGAMERIKGRPSYQLLMALSLFTPSASREALGQVADLPELDRDDGLVELEKLSLVNKNGARFSFLPLTKTFALGELTRDPAVEAQMRKRWLGYLKSICSVEGEYYWQYYNYYNIYAEAETLLQAVRWCYEHATPNDIFILTLGVSDYLENVGQWDTTIQLHEDAIELARSAKNLRYIARLSHSITWFDRQRGNYKLAEKRLKDALQIYIDLEDMEGQSITLQRLSTVFRKQKNYQEAERLCAKALQIAQDLEAGALIAVVNTTYGKLARDLQDWSRALDYFNQVQAWFDKQVEESARDEELARGTWGHLALVYYHLDQPEKAKELCLESLDFFETYGTKAYYATLKYRLALAEEALGETEAARQHVTEAVDWFSRLGMQPDLVEAEVLQDRLRSQASKGFGNP